MWPFGNKKSKESTASPEANAACSHPVNFLSSLKEDAANPTKVTAMKCMRCGARLAT